MEGTCFKAAHPPRRTSCCSCVLLWSETRSYSKIKTDLKTKLLIDKLSTLQSMFLPVFLIFHVMLLSC